MRIGIFAGDVSGSGSVDGIVQEAVRTAEQGFPSLWLPQIFGVDAITVCGVIGREVPGIELGTAVVPTYPRHPMMLAQQALTANVLAGGRFTLGIGLSHQIVIEQIMKLSFEKPVRHMREHLSILRPLIHERSVSFEGDTLGAQATIDIPGATPCPILVAALGPKMLELAGTEADGAHPYFVPVEHTPFAREHLGPDGLLAPEQAVVLSTDPEEARRVARGHMATYLGLPNYTNNLRRFGFGDDDLADGGSDRLVDAIVAWGDEQTIVDRVKAHHDGGADHVALQVLPLDGASVPMDDWRRLSEAFGLT